MITLFVSSIIVIAAIVSFGRRLKFKTRLAISVVAFLLINSPSIMFIVIGDKPPADSRIVTQEEIQGWGKSER